MQDANPNLVRIVNTLFNKNGWSIRLLNDASFIISDNQNLFDRLVIDSGGQVSIQSSSSAVLRLTNKQATSNGWSIRLLNDGSFTLTDNRNLRNRLTITPSGEMIVQGLAGAGNAYVCVDPEGKLSRQSTPCA